MPHLVTWRDLLHKHSANLMLNKVIQAGNRACSTWGDYILVAEVIQGKDTLGRHWQSCLHVRLRKGSGVDWMTSWDRELGEIHFPEEGPISWLSGAGGPWSGSRETWSFHGESAGRYTSLKEDSRKDLVGSQDFNSPPLLLWQPITKTHVILLSLVLLDTPKCNRSQIIPPWYTS